MTGQDLDSPGNRVLLSWLRSAVCAAIVVASQLCRLLELPALQRMLVQQFPNLHWCAGVMGS